MPKRSAGVLMYRRGGEGLELLLVHPGGPFWSGKDLGAWSIPKGEHSASEDPLAAAIRAKRSVAVRYATPGREETERTVAPYGLVFHGGRWYLAAHDDRSGEVRTFRVDRVRSAEARRERVVIPEGFDAADHVARSIARIPWGYEIEVELKTTLEEATGRIPRTVGTPEMVDGMVLLRARTDDLDAAARMLATLPWPFAVRRPDELRASLKGVAQMLVKAAG